MATASKIPAVALFSGARMPAVGLGTWQGKPGELQTAVQTALDVGYRHFDCAAVYGNEAEIGEAFTAKVGPDKGVTRDSLFVTSKLWNTMHHPDRVKPALRKTLADLKLEYLDLYLIHWPVSYKFTDDDTLFPVDAQGNILHAEDHFVDTWKALEACVDTGLTRHIGLSNFNSLQIKEVLDVAGVRPACLQVETHPYLDQTPLLEFAAANDIAVVGYGALGSPARPWAAPGEPTLMQEPAVKAIGDKHGKSAAQVLLRYQVQLGVVPIPKSVTPTRIAANADLFDFELSAEDMATLAAFNRNFRGFAMQRDVASPFYPFTAAF